MRIAISGTHGVGKSTLIDEFLSAHPDFSHEPEPYAVMVEDYGEEFSAEPTVEDYYRQLEFNVARLQTHRQGERVIYERSPFDFLAYLIALGMLRPLQDCSVLVDSARGIVSDALRHLDVVVFLPLDDSNIEVSDEENPQLRNEVNSQLATIFADHELERAKGSPLLIEARGSTTRRLKMIEAVIRSR